MVPFLRALERSGEVRGAAVDAGIDHTTAYAAAAGACGVCDRVGCGAGAVSIRAGSDRGGGGGGCSACAAPSPGSPAASPTSPRRGRGELVGAGSQLKRAGHDRWSAAKEKAFFDELAATANVKRAAAAAGVSANAVYARRMKHPLFKAKWAAVLETGRASIEMHLVEAANRTFDPDEIDTGETEPKVSVAEAIRIVQLHGTARQQEELPDPFAEQAAAMTEDEVAELREKLVRKLRRMRDRDMPDMIAEGWSFDEEHDQMVPPGWIARGRGELRPCGDGIHPGKTPRRTAD